MCLHQNQTTVGVGEIEGGIFAVDFSLLIYDDYKLGTTEMNTLPRILYACMFANGYMSWLISGTKYRM